MMTSLLSIKAIFVHVCGIIATFDIAFVQKVTALVENFTLILFSLFLFHVVYKFSFNFLYVIATLNIAFEAVVVVVVVVVVVKYLL
jgi:hypothetical protein